MGIIYNSLTPTDGLVLSLDTANRRSYPGSGNTWFDLSGNNNHGTLTNGASLNTGPGGGMNFDGSDDRVVASGNTSFTNGVVSICGWMRRTGMAGQSNAVLFSKGSLEGNANSTCALYWNESLGWSWFIVDAANNLTIVRSNTVTSQNQWVHVAGVASPAGVFLYVNAGLANSTTTAAVKNSTHESFFGGASVGGSAFASLLGQADDIRVYNRALSESEIRILFNSRRRRYGL